MVDLLFKLVCSEEMRQRLVNYTYLAWDVLKIIQSRCFRKLEENIALPK